VSVARLPSSVRVSPRSGTTIGDRALIALTANGPMPIDSASVPANALRHASDGRASSVTGASPYIHSRAIRCQLARARSWPSTARVSISIRRPNTCSGRMSWWRIRR
jgi:hypothetical protein